MSKLNAKSTKCGRKRKIRSFQPDVLATSIHQAINRDFKSDGVFDLTAVRGQQNASDIFCFLQTTKFLSKYTTDGANTESLDRLTYEKFLMVNDHISSTNIKIKEMVQYMNFPSRERMRCSRDTERLLFLVKNFVWAMLGEFTCEELFHACRHSSGASIGVSFLDTSLRAKFKLPLSCTEEVKPLMKLYLKYDPQFLEALLDANPHFVLNNIDDLFEVVSGSRSTTVDKNDEIRRLIAVEPTVNMFFQQGFMAMMVSRLRVFGLDLQLLQDEHRFAAFVSSILGTGATIDWSSASDCCSIELVRFSFPPSWFSGMDLVRSKVTEIVQDKKKKQITLSMFSTMGNATTFPIETILFYAIAMATAQLEAGNKSLVPDFTFDGISVFGDDCLVPQSIALPFMENAVSLGFIVNKEKSFFSDGGFRESCGGDFFHGRNVRPFQLKAPHNSKISSMEPWLYIIINNLLKKYKTYFGDFKYVYHLSFLPDVFSLFVKHKIFLKVVPHDYPEDSGVRDDPDLHRIFANWVPKELQLSPLYADKHGTISFNYCRFQYRNRYSADDAPAYWQRLKFTDHVTVSKDIFLDSESVYVKKRVGGYVVAKGLKCI